MVPRNELLDKLQCLPQNSAKCPVITDQSYILHDEYAHDQSGINTKLKKLKGSVNAFIKKVCTPQT